MDLGACPKSHMDRLKTEFNQAKEANPNDPIFTRFQNEYENNIFSFVDECDRRIRAAHRRLEKTPEENAKTTNLVCLIYITLLVDKPQILITAKYTFLRCEKLRKLSWLFKGGQRRLSNLVNRVKLMSP